MFFLVFNTLCPGNDLVWLGLKLFINQFGLIIVRKMRHLQSSNNIYILKQLLTYFFQAKTYF